MTSPQHSDDAFGFPVKPYDVQLAFAERLRGVFQRGSLGIFESPTGTGKSLSIICGALSWLASASSTTEDKSDGNEDNGGGEEGDWVAAAARQRRREDRERMAREKNAQREELRRRLWLLRRGVVVEADGSKKVPSVGGVGVRGFRSKPPPAKRARDEGGEGDDQQYCLFDDDGEQSQQKDTLESSSEDESSAEEDEFEETPKVFYCSRTHSQLSQFVGEFRRTQWAETVPMACLASRKQLCIEEAATGVGGTRSAAAINDACAELRERKKCHCKTGGRRLASFRDRVLAYPMDIEDLVRLGKEVGVCPYYGARAAVRQAQLVVLPYQMVLHAQTRESLGITLGGNVVVFDEAHNVVESVNDVHSAELAREDAESSLAQLVAYRDRFLRSLSPRNLVRVKQLINFTEGICGLFYSSKGSLADGSLSTTNEFVFAANVDAFNTFELVEFCNTSRIAYKVNGLADSRLQRLERQQEKWNPQQQQQHRRKPPPVLQLAAFLKAISNPDSDGRVLLRRTANAETGRSAGLKYLLLNPERHFREIVNTARSVALAGGTLQPLKWLLGQLFDPEQMGRVEHFSCGHVIPAGNLQVVTLCAGPTNVPFEFTFANRSRHEMVDDLGRSLCNLCSIVPDGVVCFLPSYAFMDAALDRWTSSPTGIMRAIERKKRVLREPREPGLVSGTLEHYKACIDAKTGGAVLFCVVGGKMSEGINFSDGYGRCVIVIGLPYPNVTDPVVSERSRRSGNEAAFLDDLCMRAVNQTIGRAIRHAADYALVVLADRRFTRPHITSRLPAWMAECLPQQQSLPATFSQAFALSAKFFSSRNKKKMANPDQ